MGWLDRERERDILALTDQVIEAAIALGLVGEEEKAERLQQARQKVAELAQLVEPLLEGHQDRLPDLLAQLVRQKLPDDRVLTSFGSFNGDLQQLLADGLAHRGSNKESAQGGEALAVLERELAEMAGEGNPAGGLARERDVLAPAAELVASEHPASKPRDAGLSTLETLFPGEEVRRRHPFHGVVLDYYLPGRALAVVAGPAPAGAGRRELLCRQHGVRVVYLTAGELASPRRAARALKNGPVS